MRSKGSGKAETGGVYILRIATVLLAVVSWWATAQGMSDYVFQERWQARLASLAVQGILLGLNFYLPAFWRYFTSMRGKAAMAALSLVALFCSSWFSYVYISGKVYEQAWDMESQLLIQSTYRSELYEAMDYTEEYQRLLRDGLGEQISGLYLRAQELEQEERSAADVPDLTEDRADYANNRDFAARNEIAAAITALEQALRPEAAANDREQAKNTIAEQQELVKQRLETLSTQVEQTHDAIAQANRQVQNAQARLDAAPAGTDTAELEAALESASRRLRNQQDRLEVQEAEQADYQTAQGLLTRYASQLGQTSLGSGIQISDSLRTIQSALLQSRIDTVAVENEARDIFAQLQGEEALMASNVSVYQELLTEMDGFIRDIQDYAALGESGTELDKLADEMRHNPVTVQNQGESAQAAAWKTKWAGRLEELKQAVGGLPAYYGAESQALAEYSRVKSMDRLDRMLQKYISDHNAADQAIIYLSSPYCGLAWFSMLLAFFLDIAAFITGFVIDAVSRYLGKQRSEETAEPDRPAVTDTVLPAAARRYLYLTGNFTKEDGRYVYQVFEGMDESAWELEQGLQAGFYYVDENGKPQPAAARDLLFYQMAGGPKDGVYRDCALQYSDGILGIKAAGHQEYQFLAAVGEDIPVFQMSGSGCVCGAAGDIPPQQWKTAILALNGRGTQVVAIYLA